ncbi:MAG TPA: alpha-amylase/4-alpha-glucanotransferase domain-containing protein, partial [Thermodesulfobacteriota bacterium]|nr:alpha-amylase/4-alpha-glucanotransferase domain-containing protein [Thermodesulfobacteriota bacterium]
FLVKYSESNHMHKKMLYVSQKVHQTLQKKSAPENAGPALKHLWRGQDCCAYWHGLFGGLYLNYLRHAVYQNLITAECQADTMEHGRGKYLHHEILDFDKDLYPEILVATSDLGAIFKSNYGGALIELDYRPKQFNLTNVLTRRPEAYHRKLKKGQANSSAGNVQIQARSREVEEALFYDWYTRYSFLDHFLGDGANLDQFRRCQYPELGDFVNQPYELLEVKKWRKPPGLSLLLRRKGGLWKREGKVPVETLKRFLFHREKARIEVDYEIVNRGSGEVGLWFGVELNLTLLAGDDPRRHFIFPGLKVEDRRLCSSGALPEVEQMGLRDQVSGFGVSLYLSPGSQLWRFPLETVSQSESGFQKTYQGTVLLFHWPFSLKAGEKKPLSIGLSFEGIRRPGKKEEAKKTE